MSALVEELVALAHAGARALRVDACGGMHPPEWNGTQFVCTFCRMPLDERRRAPHERSHRYDVVFVKM